jgi:Tol biopolymer transport system component
MNFPRITRFDITVLVVCALLIAAVAASVALVQPAVVLPRVAYLAPVDSAPQNIWAVDPELPGAPQQLTFSDYGVYDFSPDPTGRFIAYAENTPEGITELRLLDLANGSTQPLTNCYAEDATCDTVAWRPDGKVFAYQRRDLNTTLGLGVSAPRIWIMDLTTTPYSTFPLFGDSQTLGTEPAWSGTGTRLAFYDSLGQGVLVFDFNALSEEQRIRFIPAANGSTGTLSPDGTRLAYTDLIFGGENQAVRAVVNIAELDNGVFRPVTDEQNVDDGSLPAWHPDGRRLVITRQYLSGERASRGQQVYLVDLEADTIEPLIFDPEYNNGALSWDPDGTRLVIQRVPFGGGLPELWVYTLETGVLERAAINGFLPRWLPGR